MVWTAVAHRVLDIKEYKVSIKIVVYFIINGVHGFYDCV